MEKSKHITTPIKKTDRIDLENKELECSSHLSTSDKYLCTQSYECSGKMVKERRENEFWIDFIQKMMSEEEKVGKCMYNTYQPINHTVNLEIHVLKWMIRSVDYNDVSADLVTLTDQGEMEDDVSENEDSNDLF